MEPFLRIPPFPGHRARPLAGAGVASAVSEGQARELVDLLRRERVGGTFWAAKPSLPPGRDILLAPSDESQLEQMLAAATAEGVRDRCALLASWAARAGGVPVIAPPADPWHLAEAAGQVWAGADQELALAAALAGRPLRTFGDGVFATLGRTDSDLPSVVAKSVGSLAYTSPFDSSRLTASEAVRLLGEWRRLIDSNQQIAGAVGIAGWKRATVDTLLWDGSDGPQHVRRLPPTVDRTRRLAVWKSRTSPALLQEIEELGWPIAEIEDGLIRGHGLGANCVPPLSIVVDSAGIYFDPSQSSDLEILLESAEFEPELLRRAAALRQRIVEAGISKYGGTAGDRVRKPSERRVLVIGQVEDDRSILEGGNGQTNLELLQRARQMEPNSWLIYRPHPDVEAGHRKGHVPDDQALRHADEIDRGGSIVGLIASVDEVHCITSLAGFEALLRGKRVTTHGVPFYAGWGLTRDLGRIPERRTRRRSLDELIAASIILYPRYLDPVTGLPCPAEVLVERIALGEDRIAAPLAGLRKMQGRLKLAVRRLREAVR